MYMYIIYTYIYIKINTYINKINLNNKDTSKRKTIFNQYNHFNK